MAESALARLGRVRVVDIELTRKVDDLVDLQGYRAVRAIVRVHGRPVGEVRLPVAGGRCPGARIVRAAIREIQPAIASALLEDGLTHGLDPAAPLRQFGQPPRPDTEPRPRVTVAVCTRNRAADLDRCLDAIGRLSPAPHEVIVVDNAPADEATRTVVERYPTVRYLVEPKPGLNRARNLAMRHATGDVIAYTDDDVIVDPGWAGAIASAFADDPTAMAVTGLVLPFELESDAQELFERYGGFGRGYERRWFRVPKGTSVARVHGGTGKFGTGANMAFRRTLVDEVGAFDPALDVGTVTNGGGDLDMFYRVLRSGRTLVYEPSALVWHRHRRTYEQLRTQLSNNGIGFYSYLVREAWHFPEERRAFAQLAVWWFRYWSLRRFVISSLKPGKFPRDLVAAELVGSLRGVFRYPRAVSDSCALGADAVSQGPTPATPIGSVPAAAAAVVDVACPVTERGLVPGQVIVLHGGALIGAIASDAATATPRQLRKTIASQLGRRLAAGPDGDETLAASTLLERTRAVCGDVDGPVRPVLASDVAVSIVIATYDRPAALDRCLASICRQRSMRPIEILVVDNHPSSGATAEVVERHPGVRLIEERRPGLSYARNAGIAAATGDIVITTDDDVTVPDGWVERLVAPFADDEVEAVTGNVLPAELTSEAQRLFEEYGGLGRGMEPLRADAEWFWAFRGAVPTWRLGATANAAFRRAIFSDDAIGPLDEALGAGTPTGCSEDTDLFYRVLRAGGVIEYEPTAFVWHHHRSDLKALREQIYAYAKGHAAYHLVTWQRDRDWRALVRLGVELPRVYMHRTIDRLRGRSAYPLPLVFLEVWGTLAGPFALWRSRMRAAGLRRTPGPRGSAEVSCERRVEDASPP